MRAEPGGLAQAQAPADWWPTGDLGTLDAAELEATIAAARRGRPDFGIVEADLERERNRLSLGENALRVCEENWRGAGHAGCFSPRG